MLQATPPGSPLHTSQAPGSQHQSSRDHPTAPGMGIPAVGLFPGAARPSGMAAAAGTPSFPPAAASGPAASNGLQQGGHQPSMFSSWPPAATQPASNGHQGPLFPGGAPSGGLFAASSLHPPTGGGPSLGSMPSFGSFKGMPTDNTNRCVPPHTAVLVNAILVAASCR